MTECPRENFSPTSINFQLNINQIFNFIKISSFKFLNGKTIIMHIIFSLYLHTIFITYFDIQGEEAQ